MSLDNELLRDKIERMEAGQERVARLIGQQGGPGINHIAFEVDNIESAVEELKAKNVPIRQGDPRPGAHSTIVAFLDPAATHGVLIELGAVSEKTRHLF